MGRAEGRYGATVGKTGSGQPECTNVTRLRSVDEGPVCELPYRPATVRRRIRGRTDGSIRPRAIAVLKFPLAREGASTDGAWIRQGPDFVDLSKMRELGQRLEFATFCRYPCTNAYGARSVDFDRLISIKLGPPVDLPRLATVEGWLSDDAVDLTIRLARLQLALGQAPAVLELGVFRGKYLSLLASLFQDTGRPVVGIDAFLVRLGEPAEARFQDAVKALILEAVAGVAPRARVPVLLASFTRDIEPTALRRIVPEGYGFISVDAGHEAADVEHDFGLVETVMNDQALVAADDVFNPRVPGVAEGVCRYFFRNPTSVLTPFALCGNKVFFCSRLMHQMWLDYMSWIMDDTNAPPYIRSSALARKQDSEIGFTQRFLGNEVSVFLPE